MDGCSHFQSQKVIRTLCAHPVWDRTLGLPPTLSLGDENTIRAMKSTNEKRVAKRKLVEINKAAVARVRVNVQCKKCSLPPLAGNYGFCGVMHRVKGIDFL